MNRASAAATECSTPAGQSALWTCPFCPLLCEGFTLAGPPEAPALQGSDCPRAAAALGAHAQRHAPSAFVDGVPVAMEEAIAAAAHRLARWRQPLFGGLGTDVAGARALFRLAARCGALCDHADGEALAQQLRSLQERGEIYTTLAEVQARADLLVCVGTQAVARYPEFFRRCGLERPESPCRRIVFLGVEPPPGLPPHVEVSHLAGCGALLEDLRQLAALMLAHPPREPDAAIAALARVLRGARYAVLVWEAATLPQGALAAEMLHRVLAALNRETRAASFVLGGDDGAATVQQVFTWLSGLPLRTRIGFAGLEHDPVRFAGERLLADAAVDGLLWAWSFTPGRVPPATRLPRIVLGPPGMGARLLAAQAADDCVFLPVATPGLHVRGHLFRTDGVVVPLVAPRAHEALPGVAQVLAQLEAAT